MKDSFADTVIFLDIDGPLMPARQWYTDSNSRLWKNYGRNTIYKKPYDIRFDPVAVNYFNLWIKYSGAKIVLATNWVGILGIKTTEKILRANGLRFSLHEEPVLPWKFTSTREQNISFWLSDYGWSNYLAVDDNITGDLVKNSLVVDYVDGLTRNQFNEGLRLLGLDPEVINKEIFKTIPIV